MLGRVVGATPQFCPVEGTNEEEQHLNSREVKTERPRKKYGEFDPGSG
jgi:hypothetical protein